jgi:diguanylate cyclase (GGDEF)-like protein
MAETDVATAAHERAGRVPVQVGRAMLTGNAERGRLACVFYGAGGLLVLVAAVEPGSRTIMLGLAVAALSVSASAYLWRERFSYAATLISSVLGPGLIAAGIVAGGQSWAGGLIAAAYTFVAVHTALVLRWQHAAGLFAWATVTAVLALTLGDPGLPIAPMTAGFLLIYGTLVGVTSWLTQKVQRQAATDPLTGLANRAAFDAALAYARATVLRTDEPLSLIALDLDDFKRINDTQGHAAGDAVLVDAARCWSAQLRERDVLARTGGDEFVAILPGADIEEAAQVADRLVAALTGPVGCSAGVATWRQGQDLDQLLRTADRALYAAKQQHAETRPRSER